ncbi:MAG TPA: acetate/propionate family kinase [Candidatus Limnocylindrales bacterium]|nr:acetate/propionate family kinase [Candidatus Limnocylindrales bacterium]
MRILVVNAGSSSTKLRVIAGEAVVASTDLPAIDVADAGAAAALEAAIAALGLVDAVGHRVVHGGMRFRDPTLVDDAVLGEISALAELAPLHQPRCVAGIRAARRAIPEAPQIAAFDTAFHATLPDAAATYALPAEWRTRWPIRRYGFHGLSHAWAARRAAGLLSRAATDLRIVSCHLGAGASLAAVAGGRSVDTTMGFTPLEGLVMATRSGSVDPGLVLWLQQHGGLDVADVSDGLEHRGGLVGLARTADMRDVIARATQGEPDAVLALDVYVHRLRASIAAMAASLGGLDALVFTGGVGEHAPDIRARAVDGLGFLGVAVDSGANADAAPDARIEDTGSAPVLVIESREDVEIAAQVRATVA